MGAGLNITPIETDAEARTCARLMATSDPWVTLGRSFDASLEIVMDPTREVYLARSGNEIVGFIILCMTGAFVGYIQTVCVHPDCRGQGLGSKLVDFAEQRILRQSPNVFMCVSAFNHDARRLYERLGYQVVGELSDYIVRGHSEILLRKTLGPLAGWQPGAGSQELGA